MKQLPCLLALLCLCGCETVQPWGGPWQNPEMQWQADPMEISLQFESMRAKRLSGGGAAGGGCGCN